MTGDQLKLGVSQALVPGQPGDRLMAEGVRGRLDSRLLGVLGDDLLDPSRAELAVPLGLEEPAVMGVGSDVRSQGGGEGLAKEHVPVFQPLPWLILILQASISTSEIPMLQSSLTLTAVKNKSLSIKAC